MSVGKILLKCPNCNLHLSFDAAEAGEKLSCPTCTNNVIVPRPEFIFNCPSCDVELATSKRYADEKFNCPECNAKILMPTLQEMEDALKADNSCPSCGLARPLEKKVCAACGFDEKTGKVIKPKPPKPKLIIRMHGTPKHDAPGQSHTPAPNQAPAPSPAVVSGQASTPSQPPAASQEPAPSLVAAPAPDPTPTPVKETEPVQQQPQDDVIELEGTKSPRIYLLEKEEPLVDILQERCDIGLLRWIMGYRKRLILTSKRIILHERQPGYYSLRQIRLKDLTAVTFGHKYNVIKIVTGFILLLAALAAFAVYVLPLMGLDSLLSYSFTPKELKIVYPYSLRVGVVLAVVALLVLLTAKTKVFQLHTAACTLRFETCNKQVHVFEQLLFVHIEQS